MTAAGHDIFDTVDDEFGTPTELPWDDVVDVICAGPGPGVLAQAIVCADHGLTVELVDAVAPPDTGDPDTLAYLEAMADDLGPATQASADLELTLVRAAPVPPRTDRRARIEPFVGSRLRDWSARCLISPFGVVYSAVPEAGVTAMRTESGETIRAALLGPYSPATDRPAEALAGWLVEQARERDIAGYDSGLARLVFEYGKVAGAAVDTATGTRLVRALAGVALSTGVLPAGTTWPAQPELRDAAATVAIVGRTGSRFGRVELISES